jgi:hypothetical protein
MIYFVVEVSITEFLGFKLINLFICLLIYLPVIYLKTPSVHQTIYQSNE